jgi:hypothetical protein
VTLAAVAIAAVPLSSARDGHWRGQLEGGERAAKVSFQVKRDGRRITNFSTTVAAFCVGPTIGTNRLAILVVSVPSAKVRRNGRFKRTYKTDGGAYTIRGTLRGRRVRDGHVSLRVSTCSGHSLSTARRTDR